MSSQSWFGFDLTDGVLRLIGRYQQAASVFHSEVPNGLAALQLSTSHITLDDAEKLQNDPMVPTSDAEIVVSLSYHHSGMSDGYNQSFELGTKLGLDMIVFCDFVSPRNDLPTYSW
jgi:hypothetical protein